MWRQHKKKIQLTVLLLLVLTAGLLIFFIIKSPVAFLKSNAIKFVEKHQINKITEEKWLDIEWFISSIPYKDKARLIEEIFPQNKYQKTIVQGFGNCSNLAFGMAYYLDERNYQYQIVHIMPPDLFLFGFGHTVINTNFIYKGKKHQGIVDIFEGSIPMIDNKWLVLDNLKDAKSYHVDHIALNGRNKTITRQYGKSSLMPIIGVIPADDIRSYFGFIKQVYLPLGNKKIEKILYDGLALIFGFYPNTYVEDGDFSNLYVNTKLLRYAGISLLLMMRFLLLIALLGFILIAFKSIKLIFVSRGCNRNTHV